MEYAKSKLTQKSIISYITGVLIIFVSFLLGYQLGKTNAMIKTKELNPNILELLMERSDLPLKDIDLHTVTYNDTSYSPFDIETNILDFAYIQFSGIYLPTNEQFSLYHDINIYRPGYTPSVTATKSLYNDAIAHDGSVTLLSLSEMDDSSWGFCYTQSQTCYFESKYDNLVSQIGIVVRDATEEQLSEILTQIVNAFNNRVEASAIKYK